MNIVCLCDASEEMGLIIHYFASSMTSLKSLCATEPMIDEMIARQCLSSSIMTSENTESTVMDRYLIELQKLCLQPYLKDTVVLVKQTDRFLLFGLVDSVKRIIAENENVKQKYIISQVKLNYELYQVRVKKELYVGVCEDLGVWIGSVRSLA